MQVVYDAHSLEEYFATAARVSEERPVLIDRFLEDAFECDVDALADGERVVIGGIMQHIEDAGIHSGDSACVLPPYLFEKEHLDTMRTQTIALAKALHAADQRGEETGLSMEELAFYEALEVFEQDLHQHIHLENNLLFPKAAALEEHLLG